MAVIFHLSVNSGSQALAERRAHTGENGGGIVFRSHLRFFPYLWGKVT